MGKESTAFAVLSFYLRSVAAGFWFGLGFLPDF